MIWTAERQERLRHLWQTGAPRDEIMAEYSDSTWDAVRSQASKHRFRRPGWFIEKQNKSQGKLEGRRADQRRAISRICTVKCPETYMQSKGVWYGDEMSMVRSA